MQISLNFYLLGKQLMGNSIRCIRSYYYTYRNSDAASSLNHRISSTSSLPLLFRSFPTSNFSFSVVKQEPFCDSRMYRDETYLSLSLSLSFKSIQYMKRKSRHDTVKGKILRKVVSGMKIFS